MAVVDFKRTVGPHTPLNPTKEWENIVQRSFTKKGQKIKSYIVIQVENK